MLEDRITVHAPIDMHLHLRDGNMLRLVAPLSAATFSSAVIMPNLLPPVESTAAVLAYRERILEACAPLVFDPLMTLFFRNQSAAELELARPHIFGVKLYPAGVTTHSDAGVGSLRSATATLRLLEEMDIPLLVHGETTGFVLDRETEFLADYEWLATSFPKLRITMEHISTAAAAELLNRYENLHATVTLQHLVATLDDLAGGLLQPHLFCKPILKRPSDRDALLALALSGHPKLMFGSDSAPHPRHAKEACGCAAGVFSAPVALAHLTHLFASHGAIDKLEGFVGGIARRVHRLRPCSRSVTMIRREGRTPDRYHGHGQEVIPYRAGETLAWSVES